MDTPTKVTVFLIMSGVLFWLINIFFVVRYFL